MPIAYRAEHKQDGWIVVSDPRDGRHLLCRCGECGVEKLVRKDHVRSGRSTKCKKCGHRDDIGRRFANLPTWLYMKLKDAAGSAIRRCTNPRNQAYRNYGGRGIKAHFKDISSFVDHLLTLPGHNDELLVLDRINNDGHYEVGNLRFTTPLESRHNQRDRSQWSHSAPVQKTDTVPDLEEK